LGIFHAALGVMFAGAAAGVAAVGVGALRTARAGNRRAAALLAAVALFLLVYFTLAALQWRTAANVLFAVWAGGLLVLVAQLQPNPKAIAPPTSHPRTRHELPRRSGAPIHSPANGRPGPRCRRRAQSAAHLRAADNHPSGDWAVDLARRR